MSCCSAAGMRSRRMTPPAPRWPSSRVYSRSVNGAQALISTLVDGGVDVCFANPGTSEMHFVAALDTVPGMRGVLTLFEGVATGAAGGHATYHKKYDAPLESDIDALAGTVSGWVRRSVDSANVGRDTAEAIAAS